MTQLQIVIQLSMNCVEALDRDDWQEGRRLMRLRDKEYLGLNYSDARMFAHWVDMSEKDLARIMACEPAS